MRGGGTISSSSSLRSGGYQSVPTTSSRSVPPIQPSRKKPSKKIKPSESAKVRADPLPEGCVDLFIAESESSDEEDEEGSSSPHKNVWKKMKGRLKSDINDFTTN